MNSRHQVVVVGSGAGGAMAAYALTRRGISVLMLEAGRHYDPYAETPMFARTIDAPLRGVGTPDKQFGFYDATIDGGWDIPDEPYSTTGESPFRWFRTRMLGGRTNHWGRWTPRYGPYDFKPKSRDGQGVDWPLDYEDLATYYDRTEALVGVHGVNEGLPNLPDSAPGVLQPPPRPRAYELFVGAGFRHLGIPCVPVRRAVLTRPLDNRSACFYATECGRGCAIGAAFQTTTSLIPMALKTGLLRIIPNAMAAELHDDEDGRIRTLTYVDRRTRERVTIGAEYFVLAASSCETARILLNSRSSRFPDGLANSSGQVGRNLLDNPMLHTIRAQFPLLENRPNYDEFGADSSHVYVPWWDYAGLESGKLGFSRGYQIVFWGGRRSPTMGLAGIIDDVQTTGNAAREEIRRKFGSTISFTAQGEMIPSSDCYCEIDPSGSKDACGIPTLRFHWKWSEQELKQARHMRKSVSDVIRLLGGRVLSAPDDDKLLRPGGECIHEVGTARMGTDRRSSVTNQFGQTWDVDNLLIADGSVLPSSPHKNPTLTIMALAWRSADHLAGRIQTGGTAG